MRILITGSRGWANDLAIQSRLYRVLRTCGVTRPDQPSSLVIVHGDCPTGADAIARAWAESTAEVWPGVSHEPHPADWRQFGRGAGPRRNQEMVQAGAELCLAFIRDRSPGATGCARLALDAGIELHVWRETS